MTGSDLGTSYRRYVTAGLSEPPDSPWKEACHGWVLGSKVFIDRVKAIVRGESRRERRRESDVARWRNRIAAIAIDRERPMHRRSRFY